MRSMTVLIMLNPHAAGGRAAALRVPLTEWLRRHAPFEVRVFPKALSVVIGPGPAAL